MHIRLKDDASRIHGEHQVRVDREIFATATIFKERVREQVVPVVNPIEQLVLLRQPNCPERREERPLEGAQSLDRLRASLRRSA